VRPSGSVAVGRDDIPGWPVNADEADLIVGSLNDDHFEGNFGVPDLHLPVGGVLGLAGPRLP